MKTYKDILRVRKDKEDQAVIAWLLAIIACVFFQVALFI
jgi:hypothetical protein